MGRVRLRVRDKRVLALVKAFHKAGLRGCNRLVNAQQPGDGSKHAC
jgi:hypothetical protein